MADVQISLTTKTMIGAIAGIIGTGSALTAGLDGGTPEVAWQLLEWYCAIFLPLAVAGLVVDRRRNTQQTSLQLSKRNSLAQIANKYNAVVDMLEDSYRHEKGALGIFSSREKESLRKQYEQKYLRNYHAFEKERAAYLATAEKEAPMTSRYKKLWTWFVAIGVLTQLMACSYTFGSLLTADEPATATAMLDSQEERLWNAENIPIPHLQDASRYVSNPDNVVSDNTEQILNAWYKKLDDSLRIESVVIIVNHIENDDPFRMAQDVGNRYGVGKDDRGLVVVLAYGDHAINISPGLSLEADLTDVECRRLQQEYVIPFMKAEQPDSGMIYLAEAVYNTLQRKELPVISALTSSQDDLADEMLGILALHFFVFGIWAFLIAYLNNRYNETSGRSMFRSNPFEKTVQIYASSGGFGGGGGGFGGFGGGGGGSFGGGSFGGGGATSRW